MKFIYVFVALLILLPLGLHVTGTMIQFDLAPEDIGRSLYGKYVNLSYNQIWPFDNTQNISLKILNKKKVAQDLIVITAEIKCIAKVAKTEEKDTLPENVLLEGFIKLTYEKLYGRWYLMDIQNLNLDVSPSE